MLETAKIFFSRGEVKKSRKWFNKTVDDDHNFGDAWSYSTNSKNSLEVRIEQVRFNIVLFRQ